MGKGRIEAFSDAVIAVIITIMVLEMKVPHGESLESLKPLVPVFLSYVLSFVYVGIYWNNHHHMLHAAKVSGKVLWANLHLLFWLSLVPFTTAYIGENHLAPLPVALYGLELCLAGCAFDLLRREIARDQAGDPAMAALHRRSSRINALSALLYLAAAPLAWVSVWLSVFIYVLVPVMYFMPRNIEKMAAGKQPA